MSATTRDLQEQIDLINAVLLVTKSTVRIQMRRHGQNAFTCLEEVSATTFLPIREPFFCGTKTQAYDQLRAMIRMYRMMNES